MSSPHVTLGGVDQFRVHETDWVGPHVEQTGARVYVYLLSCAQLCRRNYDSDKANSPIYWTHCVVASLPNVFSSVCEQPSKEGPSDGDGVPRGAEGHTQLLTETSQLLPHVLHCLHVAEMEKVLMTPCLRGKALVSQTSVIMVVIDECCTLLPRAPLYLR